MRYIALFLFFLIVLCSAWRFEEGHNREYHDRVQKNPALQKAAKNVDNRRRGKEMACGFCYTMTKVANSLIKSRIPEEKITELLIQTCKELEPPHNVVKEDAQAICRRIVHENMDEIVDNLATGKDENFICRDVVGLCDLTSKEMDVEMEAIAKVRREEAEEKNKKKKRNDADVTEEEDEPIDLKHAAHHHNRFSNNNDNIRQREL